MLAQFTKSLRLVLTGLLVSGGVLCGSLPGKVQAVGAAPSRPSMTSVPIHVIHTRDGSVGYRSHGQGSPLVMIIGFGSSQDDWTPSLLNALAKYHRVITFDNGGIGETSSPRGGLTISAMAEQTAAFIEALHLRRPAVLGWSMGGMIAQALAIKHPRDIGHLVLCASLPGNGEATAISPAVDAAAQKEAARTAGSPSSNLIPVSTAAVDAQWNAIASWVAGTDPGGHGAIRAPTLIADGGDDQQVNPNNVDKLKTLIRGAQTVVYPHAGHGFLFQDAGVWAARVNRFLAR